MAVSLESFLRIPYFNFRNGCATSEDLFWKLDALQSFIRDLHWPDPEFAEHLNQRLKMMACDMIDSCIKRTDASFQNHLNRIKINLNPTDYIVPTEICAMINVVIDAKNQSFKLCAVDGIDVVSYFFKKVHSNLDLKNKTVRPFLFTISNNSQ